MRYLLLAACCLPMLSATAQDLKIPLEEVLQTGHYQPIGVGISHKGRIFMTFPKKKIFV